MNQSDVNLKSVCQQRKITKFSTLNASQSSCLLIWMICKSLYVRVIPYWAFIHIKSEFFFLFTGAWYQISFLSVASIQHPRESPTQVGTPHATTTKWHHSNTTDKNCRKRKQERNGCFFFVFTNPFVFFSTGQLYIWYYRKALAALVLLS